MSAINQLRTLFLVEGILLLLLGILAVALPILSTIGVEQLIAWLFIIGGAVQAYRAWNARHLPGFWASILGAALYIVVGILLLVYPLTGVLTLTWLLIFFFLLDGIVRIVLAFYLRHENYWGWLLVNGLIDLALAYTIWSGWPGSALWVIGLLVGINLIFMGLSQIFIATANRPTR